MLTKNQISKILSNVHFDSTKEDIISNGSVKNIVVFDKEIVTGKPSCETGYFSYGLCSFNGIG